MQEGYISTGCKRLRIAKQFPLSWNKYGKPTEKYKQLSNKPYTAIQNHAVNSAISPIKSDVFSSGFRQLL